LFRELEHLGRGSVDAQLVVTELVSNAWRHGHRRDERTIRVTISIDPAQIGIEVHDQGDGFDRPANHHNLSARDEGGGWGLLIVDQLADDWGVRRNGDTCVWALVPRGLTSQIRASGPETDLNRRG
jgi:anti-sigma regulatory factor (Ser/Thr protein kinase)